MNTGSDKQIGHALDKICGHPQFAGKQFGIVVIPDINAFEKYAIVLLTRKKGAVMLCLLPVCFLPPFLSSPFLNINIHIKFYHKSR